MKKISNPVDVLPCGLVTRPDIPFLGCTPDGKVVDPKYHPHFGVLEIKCPYTARFITPRGAVLSDPDFCCEIRNGKLRLKLDHQYYFQVQGQLALTGMDWCDFVVYTFKGMHIERIRFNKAFWNELYKKLSEFYFSKYVPYKLQAGT